MVRPFDHRVPWPPLAKHLDPMTQQRPHTPLDTLFDGLKDALGEIAPDNLGSRLQPVLSGFFEQFQLVPRRDYDAHLAALTRLEATVSRLEARISELEANKR